MLSQKSDGYGFELECFVGTNIVEALCLVFGSMR